MHARRLQLGVLSIALAGALLAGNAWAEPPRFRGWTPLSNYVSAGLTEGGTFRITVPTRAGETEIALQPVDVHAAGYHAEATVRGGERRGRRRPDVRTFAGRIESKGGSRRARVGRGGDFARVSLEPSGRVSGLLRVDGVLYDLDADTAAGDLVLQVNEVDPEKLGAVLGSCGAAVDEALAGNAVAADAEAAGESEGAPVSAAAGTLREVELGTEADALFVAQTGGVDEANARIVSIVNALNGIYEFDLGLTHRIVFQRGWDGDDPYTSTNSDTLLNQFRSNFLQNVATPTDDAQLFSGRDFDGNVVGRAFVSAACSNLRFGVNMFYQQNDSLTRLIAAHEMGHNFGADHTSQGIMAPSINPAVTWFSAVSQDEIGEYVESVSCLAEIDVGEPPVLDPIGPQDAPENETLALQLSATDPEDATISWTVLPLPVGATLSSGGLFQWTPPLDTVGCGGFEELNLTFYATDPDGNQASETVVVTVLDAPTGSPPAIDDPADRTALDSRLLSIPLSASDPDGDSLSFAPVSLPAGAQLSSTGMLSWTPTPAQIGTHELSFSATDCTDASATESVSIEVVSSAPHLTSISAASGAPGDEIVIGGQNFLGKKVRVYFGPKKAKAYAITDTSLAVLVPKKKASLPNLVTLSVLRDGVASDNTLPFTYTTPPAP